MSNLRIGPFELNVELLALRKNGRALGVGPKVAQTLLVLAGRAGEVVPKATILAQVWPEGFVGEANLSQNIYVLRKLFRENGFPHAVETVTAGYRLTVPVRAEATSQTRPTIFERSFRLAAALILTASVSLVTASAFHRGSSPGAMSASGQQAYAVGRYYLDQRTREGVRKSLDYFTKALDSDPYDARPYTAMADANVVMGDYCYGVHNPRVYFARARWYINRAFALNHDSAEAHASAGFLALHERHYVRAEAELRRGIALDATYAPAHQWLALLLMQQHRETAAAKELKLAEALDPLSVATLASLAKVSYEQTRYGDAVAFARMTLELQPQRADTLLTLARAYAGQHRPALAAATLAQLRLLGTASFGRAKHPTWASVEDAEYH